MSFLQNTFQNTWKKYTGTISGFSSNSLHVGKFVTDARYWKPYVMFNLGYNDWTCYISGWTVKRVYKPGPQTIRGVWNKLLTLQDDDSDKFLNIFSDLSYNPAE